MKPAYRRSWAANLLMCSDSTMSPSFKVKRGQQNLKVLITRLLLFLQACNVKPTCRKSWAGNLLMGNLKVLITRLLLVLEAFNVKPTYRKSWAWNLLMWSDLTLSPCFKVKRGQPKLKVFITRLLLVLQAFNVNHLMGYYGLGIF